MSAPVGDPPLAPDPVFLSRTVPIEDPGDLLDYLPTGDPAAALSWIRHGDGLLAWGEAARFTTHGEDRFHDADECWRRFTARCVVRDEVGTWGSGPIAFGSFAFSPNSATGGLLVVPEVVIGRRDAVAWLTVITPGSLSPVPRLDTLRDGAHPRGPRPHTTVREGALNESGWDRVVSDVIGRIHHGAAAKVVMARDLFASSDEPVDAREVLAHLATQYSTSWTYAVDGLIGATPELLLRRERGLLSSRVLAGTIQRTDEDGLDATRAAALAHSSKDLEEHEYAVASLLESLDGLVASTSAPEVPFVLHLANVMHLATDVTAVPAPGEDDTSSLAFAARLHPTAAVCGTPTAAAGRLIAAYEGMDRDRYAGPVGWMNAEGDGEWGIALRGARAMDARRWRLFAGCGIMGASDPASEWSESEAKFAPMREALGAD